MLAPLLIIAQHHQRRMNRSFGYATHMHWQTMRQKTKSWHGAKTQAARRVHPSKGVLCHVLFFAPAVRQEAARTLEPHGSRRIRFYKPDYFHLTQIQSTRIERLKKNHIHTLMLLMRPTFFTRCI
jgi:hypothetical protein